MKKHLLVLIAFLPLFAVSQTDSIAAGVYSWKEPLNASTYGAANILFEGKTNAMEWLQVSANTMQFSNKKKRNAMKVPANEENIIILQSGTMDFRIKDSSFTIGTGSVLLLMPSENYAFRNNEKTPCRYYSIRYRSKQPIDTGRGDSSDGSLVKDWNQTEFKLSEKGGRRNFFERPTAMCKRLEIHVTTLKGGLKSHAPHTHAAAEFTLIKEGQTQMLIGDNLYKGSAGSIYYAPSNVLHGLENTGTGNCTYFAIQFE